jgi:hypothetical protein
VKIAVFTSAGIRPLTASHCLPKNTHCQLSHFALPLSQHREPKAQSQKCPLAVSLLS